MEMEDFGTAVPDKILSKRLENQEEASDAEESRQIGDVCQWQILPNNDFIGSSSTQAQLSSGVYTVFMSRGIIHFQKQIKLVD